MYFYQITEDNPVTMKMVKFMYACDGLLKIVNILDKYCDEDEYLEILYDNIQKWINESREVLSQYDLEEMEEYIGETYIGYDGKCVVPNTRKDTSLPTTRVVKTISINLNEKETDETNIKTLKTYFNKRNKSFEDKKTAAEATNNIILNNNNIRDFWVEWGTIKEGIHKKDILCFFDTDTDEEKFKNLFINYGFILQKSKHGFWITGVKK